MQRVWLGALALIIAGCGTASPPASVASPSPSPSVIATYPICSAPGGPRNAKVSAPNAPHGLFVLSAGAGKTVDAVNQYLLNNPDVCGANFFVFWSTIDKGPGASTRYDWSSVISEIAPWESAGKTVNLIVHGAAEGTGTTQPATPKWVQSQVTLINCVNSRPTPVFWQPGYEQDWEGFIAATVKQFQDDPHVGYMRFGLGQGGEDFVAPGADSGQCKKDWDAAGLQTQWVPYNLRLIDSMGSLHSRVQLMVGLNNFDRLPDLAAMVAKRAAGLGIGFGVQGLESADTAALSQHQPCRNANWCDLFNQYAGQVPLETQTLAVSDPSGGPIPSGVPGTDPGSTESGRTGPLPPLLSTALALHTQILEIYAYDFLIAFDPDWTGYPQYHRAYAAGFDGAAAVVGTARGANPLPVG